MGVLLTSYIAFPFHLNIRLHLQLYGKISSRHTGAPSFCRSQSHSRICTLLLLTWYVEGLPFLLRLSLHPRSGVHALLRFQDPVRILSPALFPIGLRTRSYFSLFHLTLPPLDIAQSFLHIVASAQGLTLLSHLPLLRPHRSTKKFLPKLTRCKSVQQTFFCLLT